MSIVILALIVFYERNHILFATEICCVQQAVGLGYYIQCNYQYPDAEILKSWCHVVLHWEQF